VSDRLVDGAEHIRSLEGLGAGLRIRFADGRAVSDSSTRSQRGRADPPVKSVLPPRRLDGKKLSLFNLITYR